MRPTTLPLLLLAFVCDRRKEEEEEAEEGGISSPPVGLRRRKKEESCWWRKSRNRKKEEKKGLRSPSYSLHHCQLFFFRRESFGREGRKIHRKRRGHTRTTKKIEERKSSLLSPSLRSLLLPPLCPLEYYTTVQRVSCKRSSVGVLRRQAAALDPPTAFITLPHFCEKIGVGPFCPPSPFFCASTEPPLFYLLSFFAASLSHALSLER